MKNVRNRRWFLSSSIPDKNTDYVLLSETWALGFFGYIINNVTIIIIFFMMYYPTKVNVNGAWLKDNSWKKSNGVKVHTLWIRVSITIFLISIFKIKHTPINTSQIASKIMLTSEGISPKVKLWIVSFASESVGLRPGKNLSAPKSKSKFKHTLIWSSYLLIEFHVEV